MPGRARPAAPAPDAAFRGRKDNRMMGRIPFNSP